MFGIILILKNMTTMLNYDNDTYSHDDKRT